MIGITLVALLVVTLALFSGALSTSSVGGAMTLFLVYLLAALAVGIDDARRYRRGTLGWIVSVVVAVAGGVLGAGFGAMLIESAIKVLQFEGRLVDTQGPLLFAGLYGQLLVSIGGAWFMLKIINGFR